MEPIPTTIGRYMVENLVGIGGMGQIYKAHDPDIGRPVAIKLISTKLMSSVDRADYLRRFRREAQAAARCVHPNIVTIYDFALHEGQPFIAMEFVYGTSLRQALDIAPVMATSDAIRIMLQVLDALANAHALGIIHQDIKPANIMLTSEKRVKVTDFGISRFANTEVTSVSSSMGTPNYMSPEQCRGGPVDGRSDIFSAGAMLFEMVAGERAFSGHTVREVTHRIQNRGLPLLPAPVRAVAPRLQLVLERAMAKQPENRFNTGDEMAEALRQVLNSSGAGESHIVTSISPVAGGAGAPQGSLNVRRDADASALEPQLDADTLRILEHKLMDFVGPIARILVRTTAGRNRSVGDLCAQLAQSIADTVERERFRREVGQLIRVSSPVADIQLSRGEDSGGRERLPEHELERVQEALSQFIGPLARVLVRRATADASSVEALWVSLSNHIASPIERAAFLRQRPKVN